jgi:hypothetical protein
MVRVPLNFNCCILSAFLLFIFCLSSAAAACACVCMCVCIFGEIVIVLINDGCGSMSSHSGSPHLTTTTCESLASSSRFISLGCMMKVRAALTTQVAHPRCNRQTSYSDSYANMYGGLLILCPARAFHEFLMRVVATYPGCINRETVKFWDAAGTYDPCQP